MKFKIGTLIKVNYPGDSFHNAICSFQGPNALSKRMYDVICIRTNQKLCLLENEMIPVKYKSQRLKLP